MDIDPETTDLREVVQQTVEMVQQNARDNAYLRGAFEQMNQRFDNLVQSIDQRFEQVDKRFEQLERRSEQVDKRIDDLTQLFNYRFEQLERRFEAIEARVSSVEGQLNTQLRWIIGLMAPIYLALMLWLLRCSLGRRRAIYSEF